MTMRVRWLGALLLPVLALLGCLGTAAPATPMGGPIPPATVTISAAQLPTATTPVTATSVAAMPALTLAGPFDAATYFARPGAVATPAGLPTLAPITGGGDLAAPPAWAYNAVLYQVFVRAFTPEGTLLAAAQRLPDLKDLGVNLIYLMPIQPSGTVKAKGSLGSPYSIRDYLAIDPAQGTEADLRAFIQTAHGLGMKVIMDLVANHTAWDNPLITQHPDWYKHDGTGAITSPQAEWTDVAALDYAAAALRQYMIDVSLHYVTADDLDGYRCDVSDHVPLDFWAAWRRALRAAKPDVFLLSESGGTTMHDHAFDALYDWDYSNDMLTALLSKRPHRMIVSPLSEQSEYGPAFLRARYLENHDHDRWAQYHTGGALRASSALLLAINGIPFLYAGQEVGTTVRPDLFEPNHIDWAAGDPALRAFFKQQIGLRRASPALSHGLLSDVAILPNNGLAFLRRAPEQTVLVLFSFADTPQRYTLTGGPFIGTDLRSGAPVSLTAGWDAPAYGMLFVAVR